MPKFSETSLLTLSLIQTTISRLDPRNHLLCISNMYKILDTHPQIETELALPANHLSRSGNGKPILSAVKAKILRVVHGSSPSLIPTANPAGNPTSLCSEYISFSHFSPALPKPESPELLQQTPTGLPCFGFCCPIVHSSRIPNRWITREITLVLCSDPQNKCQSPPSG